MSDYWFANYEGKRLQFSRKQAGELVGNVDEAERQLASYYANADKNYQIVEGIISPDSLKIKKATVPLDAHGSSTSTRDLGAKLYCYKVEPGGYITKGHSFSAFNDSLLYAWTHRLAEAGIVTYHTTNWVGTARLLSAIYRNEQKPPEQHSTLQRAAGPNIHIKTEKQMTDVQRQESKVLISLLFLSNEYQGGLRLKKHRALVKRLVCRENTATASTSQWVASDDIR